MSGTQDTQQWIQDQLNALQAQPKIDTTGTPNDGTRPSWTSLFGDVLAGGQGPGYQLRGSQADVAGNRALLNFGINMLLASGPHAVRPDLFSAAAEGLQGAQQSLGVDQQRAAAAMGAQQEYAQKQQELRLSAIKEALPLLSLQQQYQQAQAARDLASGKTPTATAPGSTPSIATGGSIAAPLSSDKTTALAQIAQRESGGNPTALNYVANEDPTAYARGATASGKYQIVNSTWAEGAKLAGVDVAKYPTARDAPEGVQDQVASALWDKHGNTPWQKGAQDWVKGQDGRYALQPVAKPVAPPGGAQPPAPYQVATAGSAVPSPPGGAPAAPTTDLTGPRPLPPTGPGAGVATPASIANTPVQTAQAQPPAPAVAPAPQTTPTPPPSPYPDIKAGDGIIRYPGTLAEFRAREYVPPPASEVYNPNLTPEKQQSFAVRQQGLELEQRQISQLSDPVAVQKGLIDVKAKQAALQADMLTAANDKKEAADKALVEYNKNQDEQIQKRHDLVLGSYNKAAESQLTSAQKLAEINAQAGATERTAALNPINTEAAASAHRLDDLQVLKGFSNNLGDPTFLTSQKIGGKSLADIISGAGLGSQALQDKAGQAQAFHAAALSIVRDLRLGGSAAGEPRSNQDLTFITSMVPSEMQSPATRNAIISYIEQVNQRRMEYGAEVGRLVNTPEFSNNVGGAILAARQGMKDIVQTVPKGLATGGGDIGKQRLDWFRQNVQPGTFYRAPNGRMQVWHGVPGDPDYTP